MTLDSLSCAVVGLQTLVADSETFRNQVGVPYDAGDLAANRDEAAEHVYWFTQTLQEDVHRRPAAIVALGGASYLEWGQGEKILLGTATETVLILSSPAGGENDKISGTSFLAFAGGVYDDIRQNSGEDYGGAVYYPLSSGRTLIEPRRTPVANRKAGVDYWMMGFAFGNQL